MLSKQAVSKMTVLSICSLSPAKKNKKKRNIYKDTRNDKSDNPSHVITLPSADEIDWLSWDEMPNVLSKYDPSLNIDELSYGEQLIALAYNSRLH